MRFLTISLLILVRVLGVPCDNDTPLTTVTKVINETSNGDTDNGYAYEMWTNTVGGNNTVSLYDQDAAFKAEWNDPDDYLGRVGLRWRDQTGGLYPTYGNILAEYAYTRSGQGTGGRHYNYIGIYGWSYPDEAKGIPLVEWYIIDDWFGNDDFPETVPVREYTLCPDSQETRDACLKGSFNVDGAEYKVYSNIRVNKPSILGDTTFTQFFNIRQATRKCGTITISEHFKKWNSLGLRMGKLYEASFLVEAEENYGFVDYSYARVRVNVDAAEVSTPIVNFADACVDRTPSGPGGCTDARDQLDAPPCYIQPGNLKCGTSCPLDYEPIAATGKCEPIAYTDVKCRARPVQKTDCKDTTGAAASCDLFGCGSSCYLNLAKKECSLPCVPGEVVTAEANSRHCERAPCPGRIPRPLAPSSSSHSLSNDAGPFDLAITLERVEFVGGWKENSKVAVTVGGVTQTSTAVVGTSATYEFNQVFEWTNVAPASLSSVSVAIAQVGGSGTIAISDDKFKVGSASEGSGITTTYTDLSGGEYDNSYTVFFKVAVLCPSPLTFAGSECVPDTNWRCGSPTEPTKCYQSGDGCALTCTKETDEATGSCIGDPAGDTDNSYGRAANWGCWALCLLIVVLFL